MTEHEQEFSFKSLFLPLTTLKAIHWIAAIGLIVFANILFNGFVWDDKTYVLNNPEEHSVNLLRSFQPNLFNDAGQYRPLPALYFSLLYSLFGSNPFFYHGIQLLLQILVTILIFYLFKRFFSTTLSFFLTLIFLTHPIQVESVSYIATSVNELLLLFGLAALMISLSNQFTVKRIFLMSFLLLLSLLTKETGIIFIFLIVIYQFLFNKKQIIKITVSVISVVIMYLLIHIGFTGLGLGMRELSPMVRLSFGQRLFNIPAIIFYYIRTFFCPYLLFFTEFAKM